MLLVLGAHLENLWKIKDTGTQWHILRIKLKEETLHGMYP